MNRVVHMNDGPLVKQVYRELKSLHDQGFNTRVTSMHKLADNYPTKFHHYSKIVVRTNHIKQWEMNLADFNRNPILRTYRYVKWLFKIELYFCIVKDHRYRHAIAQPRTSSHFYILKGVIILNPEPQ